MGKNIIIVISVIVLVVFCFKVSMISGVVVMMGMVCKVMVSGVSIVDSWGYVISRIVSFVLSVSFVIYFGSRKIVVCFMVCVSICRVCGVFGV